MSSKATAIAPSNIAFIKYWGAADLKRAIPLNRSLSMSLSVSTARTTVEWSNGSSAEDSVWIPESDSASSPLAPASEAFARRVLGHLDRLKQHFGISGSFKVATVNNFPSDAGIASSAAGFAALACGVAWALDKSPSAEELSQLARLGGSGSATRSVMGGYVAWPKDKDPLARAYEVAPADHWALCDVIALVQTGSKKVSSLDGHLLAPSSPHFATRQALLPERYAQLEKAVLSRDFASFAELLELEAIELHLIAMSSVPPVFYWQDGTLRVMELVRELRFAGTECAFTMDAGANVHVICPEAHVVKVQEAIAALPCVQAVIVDRVGNGPQLSQDHLF